MENELTTKVKLLTLFQTKVVDPLWEVSRLLNSADIKFRQQMNKLQKWTFDQRSKEHDISIRPRDKETRPVAQRRKQLNVSILRRLGRQE